MTGVGTRGTPGRPDGKSGRVVVLGATGFVGRHASAALEAAGHEVLAVARQPGKISASCRFHPMDLVADGPRALAELIDEERPAVVVNAAGVAWTSSETQLRQGNQLLVDRLLTALDEASWRPRLIHLGTVHEYEPQASGAALVEDSPTRPVTPYGRSKLLGTQALLESVRQGRVDALVLRVSNMIGAGIPPGSLLGRIAQQLHADRGTREPVEIRIPPLRSSRDFVDAEDASEAIVAAVAAPEVTGRIVNIGSGESVQVRAMVNLLITASGRAARVLDDPGGTVGTTTDADVMRVDITAARELLGWSPRRRPEQSMRDLWQAVAAG
ncbi:NAD-dependent epimerase/dehydratase [Streptomyces montanus]|uniref:NAD-dependent epimerase/dehydratase n=1 Tax=Streptomyces montanus TaxID=2580423 RepID=A0A5R9G4I3_9ACTN|nr:NAD(P)-dependent oxidoreductase [Streptomyces montanus]TLS47683.1 NAD-dependent epimerase/dehydratase [Streptomyces montanus]